MVAFVMQSWAYAQLQSSPKATPITSASPTISDVQVSVSSDIESRLKERTEPDYPPEAIAAQIQGDVFLDVLIGKNGKVKNISVSSGDPILAHAAVSAVKYWRYEPWASGGNNVETKTTVTIHFVLTKGPIDCPGHTGANYSFSPRSSEGAMQESPENGENEVFKIGKNVKPPHAVYQPDPEYSEKARQARIEGVVLVQAIVTPEGTVARVKMERVIGYGLDQKAIDAVCQWKFDPATKDGKPVAIPITVEISFHL